MIVNEYIKAFEQLGFGMFVHFGLYSVLGKGEWSKKLLNISDEEYRKLEAQFDPAPDWAARLAATARKAGCRYITLTTRHHDGFSLFDTCGLTDYDAPHVCGRDLVREFVDACRGEGLIPFFYHTLLDWHEPSYRQDFSAYLAYLRASVEVLCTRYGSIGGIWFDGMWDKWEADWQEDALYGMIRSHQPETMIINNTGLSQRGALGHPELDSVTFERGKPQPINMEGAPKYIASEMCQVFGEHWGYTARDLSYKSLRSIIEDLCVCRRYGSNFLLNVGPMGSGLLRDLDCAMLDAVGEWTAIYRQALHAPRPCLTGIEGKEKDFVLQAGEVWYYFAHDLPMVADPDVALDTARDLSARFRLPRPITTAVWLDNGQAVPFEQDENGITLQPSPFGYGEHLVVRVAKLQ